MKRLLRLRIRKFLTQQQLAEEVGVDANTTQRWEVGDSFPRPKHLQKLCQVLSVDVDELLEPDEWPGQAAWKRGLGDRLSSVSRDRSAAHPTAINDPRVDFHTQGDFQRKS